MVNLNVKCDGGLMRPPTNDARCEPLIPTPKIKQYYNICISDIKSNVKC